MLLVLQLSGFLWYYRRVSLGKPPKITQPINGLAYARVQDRWRASQVRIPPRSQLAARRITDKVAELSQRRALSLMTRGDIYLDRAQSPHGLIKAPNSPSGRLAWFAGFDAVDCCPQLARS